MRYFQSWRARHYLEALVWVVVSVLVVRRMAPQVLAALGAGSPLGADAPSFEVRTLSGHLLSADSLRGKVVLVNVWATWCPPCRLEMPGFERVYRDRRDEGFEVLGLSTDQGGTAEVRRFLEERGITYPVAMADGALVERFGGARALPTSYLLDASGRIRYRVEGFFAEPALRAAVGRLLAERREEGSSAVRGEATDG